VKGGTGIKSIGIFSLVFIVMTSTVFTSHSAGPSDEMIRSAYRLILSEADTNKDGKLSVSECKAGYKDPGGGPRCLDSLMGGIISESVFGFFNFIEKHQAASAKG
jgi:hypothetical protein